MLLTHSLFQFFRKYSFTLLLGPSNSGKTTYFVNEFQNPRIIISCVPIEKLAFDEEDLEKLLKCQFINTRVSSDDRDLNWEGECNLLVDEFHFFTQADFLILEKIVDKNADHIRNFFVTSLSGSSQGTGFFPQIKLIPLANNIIVLPGSCFICGKETTRSACINNYKGQKQLNKTAYKACCFEHLKTVNQNDENQ